MNAKVMDHLNKRRSNNKKVFLKTKSSKSVDQSDYISINATNSEKNLRSRLIEIEELNASLEILVEQRTSKLIEIVSTNGKFLSIIAHDLRSPFSSILGILDLLKLSLKEFNKDEVAEYVDIVYNSANN